MINRDERPVNFGAVYYRRSAPPRTDWERDYERAAQDGITTFRHWFTWSSIEIAPGVFNWEPYDRHLELAAKYNIDTIIAEMSDYAPEWFYAKYPEARRENISGKKRNNDITSSAIAGGHLTMCLDNKVVREGVGAFLTAMGEHYKDMPGLFGYDIWNECSLYSPENICYCPGTQDEFRQWLMHKYKDLKTLNEAWFRFSYTQWDQVQLPRIVGPYPEFFDAIAFQNDMQEKWFKFRLNTLRQADSNHKMIAHGNAKGHSDIVTAASDDWRYSKEVDLFGYTFWYGNNCHTMMGGDMTRSASRGKEFWRAEAVGDSDWNGRTDKTEPLIKKDIMAVPENIRLDAMMSFVCGAKGFMNPRYRPLLDGQLFHAFGWYGTDGSRTDRSDITTDIAKWCNNTMQRDLWKAKPVKGEVGILLLEDSQALCYGVNGDTDIYASCIKGVYEAFIDSNIQSDIIRLEQIEDYQIIYVPYPLAINSEACEKIIKWVEKGGTLISEGCFGYFDDHGHAIEWQQPNRGFAEVFGCQQKTVHLGPDMNKELQVYSDKGEIRGGVYKQSFNLTTGQELGTFGNGDIAIVENRYRKGKAQIVGTMPGYGYHKNPDEGTRRWFASLLSYGEKRPMLKVEINSGIVARLWTNEFETYLWVLNMTEHKQRAQINISPEFTKVTKVAILRGGSCISFENNVVVIDVENRDASIIKIS